MAVVAVCTIVTVIEGYSLIVYGSVVPLLLEDGSLALTPGTAGVLGTLIYLGMPVGALTSGVVSDRVGRQSTLLVALALFGIGFLLSGTANSAAVLGGARVLSGLGVGAAITMALALARNHAPARRASLVVNITMAGVPVGGAVASLVGMGVLPGHGWRAMFFITAGLSLVILLLVGCLRLEDRGARADATGHGARTSPLRALFAGRGPLFAALLASVAIPDMFTWFGLNVWLTAAMNALDYPLTSALLFGFTLTTGAVIGSLVASALADRWSPVLAAMVAAPLTVAGLLGIVAGVRSMPLLLLCVALIGAGGHTTMNMLLAAAGDLFPAAIRGTALGWTNGVSSVGAVGPLVGGLVIGSSQGARGMFLVFGLSAGLTVLMVLVLTLTARRVAAPETAPVDRGAIRGL